MRAVASTRSENSSSSLSWLPTSPSDCRITRDSRARSACCSVQKCGTCSRMGKRRRCRAAHLLQVAGVALRLDERVVRERGRPQPAAAHLPKLRSTHCTSAVACKRGEITMKVGDGISFWGSQYCQCPPPSVHGACGVVRQLHGGRQAAVVGPTAANSARAPARARAPAAARRRTRR